MAEELPKFIDPRRLAEQAGTLSGIISPERLRRIKAPYTARRPVTLDLDVNIDDPNRLRMTGRAATELGAICQRCLGDMSVAIVQRIEAVLVDDPEKTVSEVAEDSADIIAIIDGRVDIEQFVEDEIILACPMIPMHDKPDCHASQNQGKASVEQRKKPFAGLAAMLAAGEKHEPGD